MSKIRTYVVSILTPIILGGLVGVVTSNFTSYSMLEKPFFSPPGILFPIVWTILYTLMGVSYGILKVNSLVDKKINIIYYSQLIVNLLWTIFFFVLKWRLFSFIWILLLIVLVIIMIKEFYNKNKLAGFLQIPYLLWILFAAYLNFTIYLINR